MLEWDSTTAARLMRPETAAIVASWGFREPLEGLVDALADRMCATTATSRRKLQASTIGDACPFCGLGFATGNVTTLVWRGRDGQYANECVQAPWDCVATR